VKDSTSGFFMPSPIRPNYLQSISQFLLNLLITGLVIGLMLLIWQFVITTSQLPEYILPSPGAVADKFTAQVLKGDLLYHAWVTFYEIVLGLIAGSTLATFIGYWLTKYWVIERVLSPFLIASQAIPVVAIAPLLVIWFPGLISKIIICGLIVFFPILINTVTGLKAVPQNLKDLMRCMNASPIQRLIKLEIPSTLRVFLAGLRIGATLSVIGAVVGELVGSRAGLGFLINVARGQYDTALVFVVVFSLITMAVLLYGFVRVLEKSIIRWPQ
jgi:NitT/TauT family transport system permease protein